MSRPTPMPGSYTSSAIVRPCPVGATLLSVRGVRRYRPSRPPAGSGDGRVCILPTALAGAVLTGFAGGLLGLYLRTPGMRKEGSLAPTEQGLTVAKDV
ncbi:MAG TPA: hypothetical protein VER97_08490, partial [Geodermatophilus sp.]|nr:hypothetical protein [Geodermatophilus sp.]